MKFKGNYFRAHLIVMTDYDNKFLYNELYNIAPESLNDILNIAVLCQLFASHQIHELLSGKNIFRSAFLESKNNQFLFIKEDLSYNSVGK